MTNLNRKTFAVAAGWALIALVASPAQARVHHHHHAPATPTVAASHRGRHHHHAAAAAAASKGGRHGHHHHAGAAASHGRRKHHHAEVLPETHRRHAALCQSVMVRHRWVERCRG